MKKLSILLITLGIFASCTEMLPDLSPNTPAGKEMMVVDIDYKLNWEDDKYKFESNTCGFQFCVGTYRSEKFDINQDGKADFWIQHRPWFPTMQCLPYYLHLSINGDYLVSTQGAQLYKTQGLDNGMIPLAGIPYILEENQLIGENLIQNAIWVKDGLKNTTIYANDQLNLYRGAFLGKANCSYMRTSEDQKNQEYYIAIRIYINNKPHYGWIKFNNDRIISAAIANEPNKRVIVGQVK